MHAQLCVHASTWVCTYVARVYTRTRVYMGAHQIIVYFMHVPAHSHARVCKRHASHMHAFIVVRTRACMYVCRDARSSHACVCMHTLIQAHSQVHTYKLTYIHTHVPVHTHAHTHRDPHAHACPAHASPAHTPLLHTHTPSAAPPLLVCISIKHVCLF